MSIYNAPRVFTVRLADDDLAMVTNYKSNYCGGDNSPPFEAIPHGGSGPCLVASALSSKPLDPV